MSKRGFRLSNTKWETPAARNPIGVFKEIINRPVFRVHNAGGEGITPKRHAHIMGRAQQFYYMCTVNRVLAPETVLTTRTHRRFGNDRYEYRANGVDEFIDVYINEYSEEEEKREQVPGLAIITLWDEEYISSFFGMFYRVKSTNPDSALPTFHAMFYKPEATFLGETPSNPFPFRQPSAQGVHSYEKGLLGNSFGDGTHATGLYTREKQPGQLYAESDGMLYIDLNALRTIYGRTNLTLEIEAYTYDPTEATWGYDYNYRTKEYEPERIDWYFTLLNHDPTDPDGGLHEFEEGWTDSGIALMDPANGPDPVPTARPPVVYVEDSGSHTGYTAEEVPIEDWVSYLRREVLESGVYGYATLVGIESVKVYDSPGAFGAVMEYDWFRARYGQFVPEVPEFRLDTSGRFNWPAHSYPSGYQSLPSYQTALSQDDVTIGPLYQVQFDPWQIELKIRVELYENPTLSSEFDSDAIALAESVDPALNLEQFEVWPAFNEKLQLLRDGREALEFQEVSELMWPLLGPQHIQTQPQVLRVELELDLTTGKILRLDAQAQNDFTIPDAVPELGYGPLG